MRVFLDANILFSAAAFDGVVRHTIALLKTGGHECWADPYVIDEARRNLSAKRPASLSALANLIARMHIAPAAESGAASVPMADELPEKDRPVLAAAIRGGCEVLVTGDRRHFGSLYGRILGGVAIHSPASLIDALFPG